MSLRALAVFVNLAAVLIGIFYYKDQLSSTVPLLLLFVPDCPLYVLLLLFGILARNSSHPFFSFFVSAGLAKYGLWTLFVLLFFHQFYLDNFFIWAIFVIGHFGMALEGFAFSSFLRPSFTQLFVLFLWFLMNDFFDYVVGTAPPIPPEGALAAGLAAIALSASVPLFFFFFSDSAFFAQLRKLRVSFFGE
ncbi:MAG: DUF1405 domain-containing protein [Candidatus Micrarchaeota archaeon]|nr:DUF1405 domain-containing protein [Candidatus Micrarchaeota archaeon]